MSNPRGWRRALAAGACGAWVIASAGVSRAEPTPDNAELYRMILELKAGQQQLVDDAAKARAEAAQAREQLEATQKELEAAQQKLETAEPAETVAATPPVSAASEEGGLVRQANLARGLTPWAEVHMARFTDNNQDFASLSTAPSGSTEILTTTNKIVQSNYEVAWKIGGTWQTGGATDFTAGYQSFDNHQGDAKLFPPFETPDGNEFISLIATLAPPSAGQNAESAEANDEFKMQIFDAEIGQSLIVGEKLGLRLSGGIRYAHLAEHFQAFYYGGDFSPMLDGGARSNFDFDFWGVGPRVAAGGRYPLPWGFSVFGQLGVSILVGEKEAESGFTDPADDTDVAPLYFAHRDYGVQVMPAIDMRAGLGWEHGLGEWGKAFVDGGYEFQNYFNVVEQLTWGPPGFEAAVGESTGDLGIDGFFFRGGFRFFGP
jgi:hypothetical protein